MKNSENYIIESLQIYAPHVLSMIEDGHYIKQSAKQLELARKSLKFTQEHFAKTLGISKQRYLKLITDATIKPMTMYKYIEIAKKLRKKHRENKSKQ